MPAPRRCPPDAPWICDTGAVDAAGIHGFLRLLEQREMPLTSLLIHRGGRTVFAHWWWPFRADLPHMLHSATKSFTGTAAGFALGEGRLRLDDRVTDFFPEHLPARVGPHLRAMTVRDLLTMRTGHTAGVSGATWRLLDTSWVQAFLAEPVPEPPGQRFTYSSATSHMLSAVVQRATGEPVADYLTPRLFEPLGYRGWTWDSDPEGISTGGNGLSLRAQDFLAYGVLHLRGGRWGGQQVLPPGWAEQASAPHVDRAVAGTWNGSAFVRTEDGVGGAEERYGYQLWLGPGPSYYAAGIFGQYCFVLPGHDTVVAVTGAMGGWRHRGLPDLVAEHLLPALQGRGTVDGRLEEQLARTGRPKDPGAGVDPAPGLGGSYACEPNEEGLSRIAFRFEDGVCKIRLTDDRGAHVVRCGLGQPLEGMTTVTRWRLHHSYQPAESLVVGEARWTAPTVLKLTWRFAGSPFTDTVVCRFDQDRVALDRSVNVNTGPCTMPTVRARRSPADRDLS
ncbi:serine hydrolase domain-containing protein [Peterkaempfera sp. SMS 1(5)a]|uniref:serine hydrolase domain-containing protein n=1 Tax=Peterkaempfera podocarpi TaxID=3232308 RepID=UPI003670185B